MKIGIPQGLLYYSYYPLWKTFFENLGAEVVTSGDTNKNILDYGVKLCVDEACLPVKIYHGHVKSLADKVDALFIPRIVSISRNEYICPKFCGLPEMIKNSIPYLPEIIECTVNLRKSSKAVMVPVMEAGSYLTDNRYKILSAYKEGLDVQRKFDEELKRSGNFKQTLKKSAVDIWQCKKIALLGHPYNVYDSYANMDIEKKLRNQGFSIITIEMLDEYRVNRNAQKLPKRHFWTFGRKLIGSGLSFIERRDVDGIIYLSSFGCGIDSLIEDYLARHIKRVGNIPYMKLVLDEHSGEVGLDTRLEAFIDMIRWRDKNEGDISTYGGNLCSGKGFS